MAPHGSSSSYLTASLPKESSDKLKSRIWVELISNLLWPVLSSLDRSRYGTRASVRDSSHTWESHFQTFLWSVIITLRDKYHLHCFPDGSALWSNESQRVKYPLKVKKKKKKSPAESLAALFSVLKKAMKLTGPLEEMRAWAGRLAENCQALSVCQALSQIFLWWMVV